jgi:hypothetical protein
MGETRKTAAILAADISDSANSPALTKIVHWRGSVHSVVI